MHNRFLSALSVLILIGLISTIHSPARAANINVTCNTVDLIAAINTANSNVEADTLNLASGCVYGFLTGDAIHPDSALPRVASAITINGNGAIFLRAIANADFRLLRVEPSGNLTLDNVILFGGSSTDGGGIYNDGTLTVTHSTLAGNNAGSGGGIYNSGTLTLIDSVLSGNSAIFGGGIASGDTLTVIDSALSGNSASDSGGGIYNGGTTTLTNTTIYGNTADAGGGVFIPSGTLTVTNATISDNSASSSGGGVYNNSGTLTVTNTTISGNSADAGGGGGVYNNNSGTLTVTNSTISDNSASLNGGGIENSGTLTVTKATISGNSADLDGGGIHSGDTLTVTNATISGNSAGYGGGGIHVYIGTATVTNATISGNNASIGGGGIYNFSTLTVTNSIVWGNQSQIGGVSSTVSYSIVQGGYFGTGNLDADPLFVAPEPFANAPTTAGDYRLQSASPAKNAGSNAALPADTLDLDGDLDTTEPIPFDRDGNKRVVGGIVDMGAYEVQPVNLIVNGSFEAGIAPWSVTTLGKDKVNGKNPYDGLFAFRFKGFAGKPTAKLTQTILTPTIADGEVVTAAAYIQSGLTANGKMTIKVKTDLGAVFKDNIAFDQGGVYALHQIDLPITLAAGETVANVKLQFKDRSLSGKVYVDAVSVTVDTPAVPRAATRSPVLPPPAAPSGFRGGN